MCTLVVQYVITDEEKPGTGKQSGWRLSPEEGSFASVTLIWVHESLFYFHYFNLTCTVHCYGGQLSNFLNNLKTSAIGNVDSSL